MPEPVVVTVPHESVNDETVRILSWKVASGSHVENEQHICDVETSKAVVEMCSPAAGVLEYSAAVGSEVPVGSKIFQITPEADMRVEAPTIASGQTMPNGGERTASTARTQKGAARLTPLARRVANEHGIDPGSFPAGMLVRKVDVLRRAGKLPSTFPLAPDQTADENELGRGAEQVDNAPVAGVAVEWSELPRRKILEARTLSLGQKASIQSSVTRPCRALRLRARLNQLCPGAVALTALIVFETARLLRKYPVFNAVHNRGRMGRYQDINVGWAIDGGEGLVVAIIKQADQKGFREISAIMEMHLEAYVGKTLTPGDFLGGTFTVSDLSADGASFFQPLISQGQSAILGVGSEPTPEGGELLQLTLAFDHRLAEGRTAAHFLRELASRLEIHGELSRTLDERARNSSDERYCVLCQRDQATLQKLNAVLMKSEIPVGLVCSICLAGYL